LKSLSSKKFSRIIGEICELLSLQQSRGWEARYFVPVLKSSSLIIDKNLWYCLGICNN
jgi:hypothetical protein